MAHRKNTGRTPKDVAPPVTGAPREFNPLLPKHLARLIAEALNDEPGLPLPPSARFEGAGVYALYYSGPFQPYAPISGSRSPIYVGVGVPKGSRKGAIGLDAPPGTALLGRLLKHHRSISSARNLDPVHFVYRALIVDPFYASVAETLLIQKWIPIWNRVITGFGINAPGKRRETQYRSLWDTIHPGREYAARLAVNPLNEQAILDNLRRFFEGRPAELREEELDIE